MLKFLIHPYILYLCEYSFKWIYNQNLTFFMGKGDVKTKRGKLFRKSYGVRRPRKKNKIKKRALEKNPQDNAPDLKKKMTEIKVEEKEQKGSKGKKTSAAKAKGGSGDSKEKPGE